MTRNRFDAETQRRREFGEERENRTMRAVDVFLFLFLSIFSASLRLCASASFLGSVSGSLS